MKIEWKRKRKEIKGRTYLLITGKETWKKRREKIGGVMHRWFVKAKCKPQIGRRFKWNQRRGRDRQQLFQRCCTVSFVYTQISIRHLSYQKPKKKKNIRKEGMPIIQNPQRLLIQFTIIRNSILCFQTRQTKTFWPIFSCKDAIGFAWSVNISFMGYVKDGSYMASWVI